MKVVPFHQDLEILKSFLLFLNLGYGADLGRSRYVTVFKVTETYTKIDLNKAENSESIHRLTHPDFSL